MSDTIQLGVRVPADVAEALRNAGHDTPTEAARAVLTAWATHAQYLPHALGEGPLDAVLASWRSLVLTTQRELRGRFSTPELNLILDVMNGCAMFGLMAGQHLVLEVEDGISLNRLHEKWDVDTASFRERLHALTRWECYVVELWAAQWWAVPGNDGGSPEAQAVFRILAGA